MKISDLQKKIAEKEVATSPPSQPLVKRETDRPEEDILDPIDVRRMPPSHWKWRPNLGCGRNYMD